MRLAVIPITSFRHLKGESEVVLYSSQIQSWIKDHPGEGYYYLILPRDCKEQGWVGDDWPGCHVVWEDELGLYYDKLAEVPVGFTQLFNPRNGIYPIDGVITTRRATSPQLARWLWDYRLKRHFPVFVDESMVVEWGKTPSTVSDIEVIAQTMGYAFGHSLFDTETQKQNATDAARRWLSGAGVLKMLENSTVIASGFKPGRIDEILAAQPPVKEEQFTLFFGGRLNRGSKRVDKLLAEYDSFFRFGRDAQIVVCSPKDEGWLLDYIRKAYPEIQVLVQTPSDEFKARAARAHVFMNTSMHEGFTVGFAEMCYMTKFGTVMLAPRLPWVKGMLKEKYEEYPFLYEDFDQARAMLRWVYENYEAAADKCRWLGDWMASQYDQRITDELHWQHYKGIVERELDNEFIKNLIGQNNRQLTSDALEQMPQVFSLNDLYETMRTASRAMKADPRRGQVTRFAVRRWLMNDGLAKDLYDGPDVRMEKL